MKSYQFAIDDKIIGASNTCYVIAEACDNHFGSIDRAIEMCKAAKLAGADFIKFQHHLPDEEMLPSTPLSDNFDEPLYDFLVRNSLSIDEHSKIKDYCCEIGISYLCTPFSWAAAIELNSIGVSAFKIGSGEMTDIPTLVRISSFGKPLIISTGMSNYEEIDRTYNSLSSRNVPLSLLNCISEYPPAYEDINLNVIPVMKKRYEKSVIGHSDHSPDLYTSFAAAALGASLIEKHVTLDKRHPGPDQSVSIDFNDLSNLVDGIKKVIASLGSRKAVHKREEQIRQWAFRSIVSTTFIPAGTSITDQMIWSKRPGTGIPSWRMDDLIGKVALRDIPQNSLLSWSDLSS